MLPTLRFVSINSTYSNKTQLVLCQEVNIGRITKRDGLAQNGVWFGTEGGGLNYLSSRNSKKYHDGFLSFKVNLPRGQQVAYDILDISTSEKQNIGQELVMLLKTFLFPM